MTACPVHTVTLPGCPHPNPADTYRASATGTTTHYHWEFQRLNHGIWSHQAYSGQPQDPRGAGHSDQSPEVFGRNIARIYGPDDSEPWMLVVWDRPGVGALPVYTITSEQVKETF